MSEKNELVSGFMFNPQNLKEAMELCTIIANSGFAPKGYENKPGGIFVAIQMGRELGLAPMQSLQNIAVINGRPSIWGDAALALVQSHKEIYEYVQETWDEATKTARCIAKRRGDEFPSEWSFSMADAARIKVSSYIDGKKQETTLAQKDTYQNYPRRMCQMRARSFALRDKFADVLKGLVLREEAEDYPTEETKANAIPAEVIAMPKKLDVPAQQEHPAPQREEPKPVEPPAPTPAEPESAPVAAAPAAFVAATTTSASVSYNTISRKGMRPMQSKFPGSCNDCKMDIIAGTSIYYDATTKKAYHIECPYVTQ